MPPFLLTLLTALVPLLVHEAERIIGKGAPDSASNTPAGLQKHAWVTDAVNDFIGVLETKVPDWVKPEIEAFKPVLDDLIEQAVAKL